VGDANHSLNQYEDAILYGKKGLDIALELEDKEYEMKACLILGDTYNSMKQYDDALLYGKKCHDIAHETGIKETEMNACLVLGGVYRMLNQDDEAIAFGKKCLGIAKETNNRKAEMRAHRLLGRAFADSCQVSSCFFHLNEGIRISDELNDNEAKEGFTELLAMHYLRFGIDEMVGNTYEPYKELTTCSEEDLVDDLDQAMKTNNVHRQSLAFMKLNNYYEFKHQHQRAIGCLKQINGLEVSNPLKAVCFTKIARAYVKTGEPKMALQCCEDGLTVVYECNVSKMIQLKFFELIGVLYYVNGQLNFAEKYLREAIQCFEKVFESLGNHDNFKVNIVDRYIYCYKCLSVVLIENNKIKEAHLVSDRCRARALKDLFTSKYGMKESSEEERVQYRDIEALVSTKKFTLLFYTEFLNVLLMFVAEDGHELQFSHNAPSIGDIIDRAFGEMEVYHVRVVNCENRCLDTEQDIKKSEMQDRNEDRPIHLASIDNIIQKTSQLCHLSPNSRGDTPGYVHDSGR
jgi:tetratricopeptide (TPR) repeat protein